MRKWKFPVLELVFGAPLLVYGIHASTKQSVMGSFKAAIFSKLGGFGDFLAKMPIIGIGPGIISKICLLLGGLLVGIAVLKILIGIVSGFMNRRNERKKAVESAKAAAEVAASAAQSQEAGTALQLSRSDKF